MSRYKSVHTAYNPQKKKNMPIWRPDINTLTVTHFNADTFTEEHNIHNTDYSRYYLHYSYSKYPDRLRRLINEGKIVEYLDNLELKVGGAIDRQVELWKQTDSCYQASVLSRDADKMLGLKNCFIGMTREVIFDCIIYI